MGTWGWTCLVGSLSEVGGYKVCWICLKFFILLVWMSSTSLVYLSICVEFSSIFLSSSDSSSPVKVCALRSKNLCLPSSLFSWSVVLPWKVMTSEAAWTRSGEECCLVPVWIAPGGGGTCWHIWSACSSEPPRDCVPCVPLISFEPCLVPFHQLQLQMLKYASLEIRFFVLLFFYWICNLIVAFTCSIFGIWCPNCCH